MSISLNNLKSGDAKDGAGSEFLAFTLGSEEYGIDILKVQEIRGYEQVMAQPHAEQSTTTDCR